MPFFSKVFTKRDSRKPTTQLNGHATPVKPQWSDAWLRTRVDPEEVVELLRGCTAELKSRALDLPFLLLPFRPTSDPSAARTFVRNYFFPQTEREELRGATLLRELRLTEPMVLASVMKWCWSRLPGGVVTWEGFELFRVGERDSGFARDAFTTFLPISVDCDARVHIIREFFDLMAAIAAHGNRNGMGGRKLSRFAGWWAFEHYDTGKGFDSGYRSWESAANATSHLFFAYLRSLSPDSPRGANGIMGLPISLQQLMESTEYPPESSHAVINDTTKVVMIVDVVSPTPFALLRRAKNFEYRDDDVALQQFSNYDDPIQALTDECRRVLRCISSTNQSNVSNSKNSTSLADPSWSRFEDIGFGSTIEESDEEDGSIMGRKKRSTNISASPRSQTAEWGNRPTTPSWADFLSSGFVDENGNKATSPVFLPPDKMLPPIKSAPRGHSSQSHRRQAENDSQLEPGELASIDRLDLDDSFWWVWISSLAGEEPTSRKAAFGRCALIETIVAGGKWMILEEQVKGAAPEATIGGYIAEKKGFFSTARGRLTRRRSQIKKSPLSPEPYQRTAFDPSSRVTILPDQHARIQAAAAELSRKKRLENVQEQENNSAGAEKQLDSKSKRNSTLSLQPFIMTEASPAMKWANQYDKQTTRAAYLGDNFAGRGSGELLTLPANGAHANGSASTLTSASKERELPAPPKEDESRREISSPVRQTSPPVPEHVQHVREASPVMSSSPPAPTMAPPPLPANPVGSFHSESAVEAAAVPLPSAHDEPAADFVPPISAEAVASRPETPPRPHSRLRKMSMDTSPTQKREKKKAASKGPPPAKSKQPPLGFRQFFGSRRDKSKERFQPAPLSPADPNPAVAAARAALEGRGPAKDPEASSADVAHLSKMRTVNPTRPQPTEQRPITPPASDQEELTTAKYDETTPVAQNLEPEVDHSGPRTRRDEEYDNLSRVDTNERENADREFSNFDQGPLVEQPAFAARESAFMPTPSPQPEAFVTPDEEEPAAPGPFLAYNSVTAPVPVAEHDQEQVQDEEVGDLTKQVSPMDRWAQIRKNAAERAARMSEEHTRRPSHTETKTDDGETSGEETIESRVARIKARVAELTGNMETTRR